MWIHTRRPDGSSSIRRSRAARPQAYSARTRRQDFPEHPGMSDRRRRPRSDPLPNRAGWKLSAGCWHRAPPHANRLFLRRKRGHRLWANRLGFARRLTANDRVGRIATSPQIQPLRTTCPTALRSTDDRPDRERDQTPCWSHRGALQRLRLALA